MKKLSIFLLALIALNAQAQNKFLKNRLHLTSLEKSAMPPASNIYSLTVLSNTYQNITGTVVSNSEKWDDLDYVIPIGFNFNLYSSQGNTINISGGSFISFNDLINDPTITAATPIFEDLCDRAYDPNVDNEGDPGGISNISYVTTGPVGNRICKIEVNNAGFYGEIDANATSTSFMNYQIWLYETTDDIEFRFGNCFFDLPNSSLNFYDPNGWSCGLFEDLDANGNTTNSNMLSGPAPMPTMLSLDPNFAEVITTTIANGLTYRFTKTVITSVKNNSKAADLKLYPNPAKDKLYIANISSELNNATIEFYDVAGKQIHSEKLNSEINISTFNKGVYLVKVKTQNNENVFVNKIVITE